MLLVGGNKKKTCEIYRDSPKKGELTLEEAAEDIARPCQCGIGNKKRAQELFRRLAGKASSG
jgi:hypothetical protein